MQPFIKDDIFCRKCHHSLWWNCASSFSEVVLCLSDPVLRSVLGPISAGIQAIFDTHDMVRKTLQSYIKASQYKKDVSGSAEKDHDFQQTSIHSTERLVKAEQKTPHPSKIKKVEQRVNIKMERNDQGAYDELNISASYAPNPSSDHGSPEEKKEDQIA